MPPLSDGEVARVLGFLADLCCPLDQDREPFA